MHFFDCNAFFGLPMKRPLAPVPTAEALLAEMDRAGVDRALVWHIAQHDASPQAGNQFLADAIRAQPRLVGCWTILPNQAREFPPLPVFFREMRAARVRALRIYPRSHRFCRYSTSIFTPWDSTFASVRLTGISISSYSLRRFSDLILGNRI